METPAIEPAPEPSASAAAFDDGALGATLEAAGDGVLVCDLQCVRRCNTVALRLLGTSSLAGFQPSAAEWVRRFGLRAERGEAPLKPDDLPMMSALEGRRAAQDLWLRPIGSAADTFVRCTAMPIFVDGHVEGVVVVITELDERLQLRRKRIDLSLVQNLLQKRDAEWRALVDGARDYAIYTLDTDGRITSWHPGTQAMMGYTADEAIGTHFARLFTHEDRAAGQPKNELALAARHGEYQSEGLRLHQDGSTFDAAVVLTALRGPRDELLGFLKLTQNISIRRRDEREREAMLADAQAARAEAERANRTKGEFLATLSHELRTPLSAIVGWAHLLQRGRTDPQTVEHGLEAIGRNARVQGQLIEDLLDMSRIESGKLGLDLQRIELGGLVAAAVDSSLPAASAKGIGLRTVHSPTTGRVLGDAARLQQVVANLLDNAIKFTPHGGQVCLSLTHGDGHALVAVADTGQGIAPEFLGLMFDRFQQQDGRRTRRHGGLGLGLSIVRHLVLLHGGTVQAFSAGAGQGATFTVALPLLVDSDSGGDSTAAVDHSGSLVRLDACACCSSMTRPTCERSLRSCWRTRALPCVSRPARSRRWRCWSRRRQT